MEGDEEVQALEEQTDNLEKQMAQLKAEVQETNEELRQKVAQKKEEPKPKRGKTEEGASEEPPQPADPAKGSHDASATKDEEPAGECVEDDYAARWANTDPHIRSRVETDTAMLRKQEADRAAKMSAQKASGG